MSGRPNEKIGNEEDDSRKPLARIVIALKVATESSATIINLNLLHKQTHDEII